MSCSPVVTGSTLPVAIATRFRLELPFSAVDDDQRRAVLRPDNRLAVLAARRGLVAADAAGDVEVVVGRQVLRRAAGRRVARPRGRAGCTSGSGCRVSAPTNAMRLPSGDDARRCRSARRCSRPCDRAARGGHAVEICVAAVVVVRLGDAVGDEVDRRAVRRPLRCRARRTRRRHLLRRRRFSPCARLTRRRSRCASGGRCRRSRDSRWRGRRRASRPPRRSCARGAGLRVVGLLHVVGARSCCVNAIVVPSGDHAGPLAPRGELGERPRFAAVHAAAGRSAAAGPSRRSSARTKAIHLPSGDHRGVVSRVPAVSASAAIPIRSTTAPRTATTRTCCPSRSR